MVKSQDNNSMSRSVGRRKTASARVRLTTGTGIVTVNGKTLKEYFPYSLWQQKVMAPLTTIGRLKDFDISVKVVGGGVNGQADAVRHGIARALVRWNTDLRPALKAEGFLTRDSREKERKHFGHKKARRGHQWKKR